MAPKKGTAVAVSIDRLSQTYPVPFLRLKKLLRRKFKPPVEALRNVTFKIHEGEIFGIFLAVLLPFSLWVFGRAVRRAKREGSLIQY
jgi:hypothetical protein